jgi:hypothetical protein
MTDVIPLNVIVTPEYLSEVRQLIALQRIEPDWDYDEDDELTIDSRHVEEMLRYIAISCGGTSFTDWVRIVKILGSGKKRMSDDLIWDLKRDRTLPETFDSLDQFRSYLRMEGACIQAMRQAYPVWRRYQYWLERRARS